MASVSSLDKDMRNIRLSKYTPQAANEIRTWIEGVLGEPLATGDVLDALKDGIALCKLINLASPSPGVRFKSSKMPFVQMENISHFLRACQQVPISLHSHDIFQTVDLYERKDPAQVLQCIAAFSRRAHAVQPERFPTALGGEKKTGVVTPSGTRAYGSAGTTPRQYGRERGVSNTSDASSATSNATSYASSQAIGGRGSPARTFETSSPKSNSGSTSSSAGGVSSWSKRQDEGATIPAWNIHQYGYMGGASQGNQGIMFGGRRQITSPAPKVPSLAEKERKRREQEAEAERIRLQAEEAEHKQRIDRQADEEREKAAEERQWEEATRKQREAERLRVEEEKRRWEEEECRWKDEEERRANEEREAEARSASAQGQTVEATPKLQGQFLSQHQAEQQQRKPRAEASERAVEHERVQELERQLEQAKERETRYERERQERIRADGQRSRPSSQLVEEERHPRPLSIGHPPSSTVPFGSYLTDDDDDNERSLLQQAWQSTHDTSSPQQQQHQAARPLPDPITTAPPKQPPRALPTTENSQQLPRPLPSPEAASRNQLPTRPLPNPASYAPSRASPSPTRKSPFARPISTPSSPSTTAAAAPPPPQPPSNPPRPSATTSSLLSREMELDRHRQAEWEEAQKATHAAAAAATTRVSALGSTAAGTGSGPGESWDVNQYGYLGGDSQNRGGLGIGIGGGGRRQVVGDDPGERDSAGEEGGEPGLGQGLGPARRVGGPREMPR